MKRAFVVDSKTYEHDSRSITGGEIRSKARIPRNHHLCMDDKFQPATGFREIGEVESVDLDNGQTAFFTLPPYGYDNVERL